MAPTVHVCKFDPTHGLFVSPVVLAAHYAEFHPEYVRKSPPASKRVSYRCRVCGRVYRHPASHAKAAHPDVMTQRPYTANYFDPVDPDDTTRAAQQVDRLNRHAVERRPQPEPAHGPWEVDDVVLPVVHQLAAPSGLIPVAHLAAILAWRDATARMLAAVTQ